MLLMYTASNAQQVKCSDLRIGHKYTLLGYKPKSPFEKRPKATVRITRIKEGWIEYCWHYEYDRKDKTLFSRNCEEFLEMVNSK